MRGERAAHYRTHSWRSPDALSPSETRRASSRVPVSPSPRLTLCLPGALRDGSDGGALARLLAGARSARVEPDGMLGALAARLGLARQRDWPIAPIVLAHAGLDPGTRYWLRATPVTLEVGQHDVRLAARVRGLDRADADTIIALLNRHFAADGLAFVARAPDDWFVALHAVPDLLTQDLEGALGARVRPHLPQGRDAPLWLRWLQEIEMLLHGHAAATPGDGAVLPNALWLQHGGVLPPRGSAAHVHAWTAADDVIALAGYAGARVHDVPRTLDEAMEIPQDAVAIVVAAGPGDAYVAALEGLLSSRRIADAEIVADAPGMPAIAWSLGPRSWWQRLRRPAAVPLRELVERVPGATP